MLEIPHPFIKRFLIPRYREKIPFEWLPNDVYPSARRRILVCLQWGYSGELPQFENILENGIYPQVFEEIFEKTRDEVEWCLRLHPVQIRDPSYASHCKIVAKLADRFSNVSWHSWSKYPLPILLPMVDGCVSMSSMSSYDASYFGVPSFLMCPELRSGGCNQEWFEDLVEDGYARKSEATLVSVYDWMRNASKKPPYLRNIKSEGAWEAALETLL